MLSKEFLAKSAMRHENFSREMYSIDNTLIDQESVSKILQSEHIG